MPNFGIAKGVQISQKSNPDLGARPSYGVVLVLPRNENPVR